MTVVEEAHTNDGGTDQHHPGGAVVAVARLGRLRSG